MVGVKFRKENRKYNHSKEGKLEESQGRIGTVKILFRKKCKQEENEINFEDDIKKRVHKHTIQRIHSPK